jgi:hypothetical protein
LNFNEIGGARSDGGMHSALAMAARHQIATVVPDQQGLSPSVKSMPQPMQISPLPETPTLPAGYRLLTEADAVDIWIARWLKIRPRDLIRRYGCDPRRLYEIWQEERFPGSRARALDLFGDRFPALAGRIDPGPHVRLSKAPHPDQLHLFD